MARRTLEKEIQTRIDAYNVPEQYTAFTEGPQHKYPTTRKGLYCMQFAPDGSYLAAGYNDGSVEALKIGDDGVKFIKDIKGKKYGNDAATCIRFHPSNPSRCYVSTGGGAIEACDCTTGVQKVVVEEPDNKIHCMDFDNRGKVLCTGGADLDIRAYDGVSHKLIRRMDGYHLMKPTDSDARTHSQRVFAIKFHPTDYDIFLSGGWENNVKIWDLRRKNAVVTTLSGPHICGDTIDFQGSEILCGSWSLDGGVQIWDYTYRSHVKNVPLHHGTKGKKKEGDYIYCCQFCPNDVIVAGGSGTGSVQAINRNTDELLGEIEMPGHKGVTALDVTHGSGLVAFGGTGEIMKTAKLT